MEVQPLLLKPIRHFAYKVTFLADRGFADTQLMAPLRQMDWHFRIRIKSTFWIHPSHLASFQVSEVDLAPVVIGADKIHRERIRVLVQFT